MIIRESGMPDEQKWDDFFDPTVILPRLGLNATCGDVAEFGCGYGTFTLAAARIISGTVYALDIEPAMIEAAKINVAADGITNVRFCLRDFVDNGAGLSDGSVDYVMLFNILHAERPNVLLEEAHRILISEGKVGIIHWNYDSRTPRGPSMRIRPRPEQCIRWATQTGFRLLAPGIIDLPPYHYGIIFQKTLCGELNHERKM